MEKFNQKFSQYFDYLDDIRRRVYKVAIVFFVFFIIGFFEAGTILKTIVHVFNLEHASIVTTSPFQFLDLATKIGLYTGLLVCLPLVIYHVYDFLKEGLVPEERKLFFVLIPVSVGLFIAGFAYSFCILYFYLNAASSINLAFGISNVWDISNFLAQVILASFLLGIVFQFPILLTMLIRTGLIRVEQLRAKRFYAFAGIFLFVGLLPPPDIFSTFVQALPLLLLFQATVWVNSSAAAVAEETALYHLPSEALTLQHE